MKIRMVICSTGPRSQLTYIIPFIASSPRKAEAYFSPGSPARFLSWPPYSPTIHLYFYLQTLPRHNGIGSLPSATNTICSVPLPGFSTGAKFFGIAQYIPANANAVSTISAILFMGEFS
jgi:hypothetical protein